MQIPLGARGSSSSYLTLDTHKQSSESHCDHFIINGKKEELQECGLFHPHVEVKSWSEETHPKGPIFFH